MKIFKFLVILILILFGFFCWREAEGYVTCERQNEIEVPLYGFLCINKIKNRAVNGDVSAVERYVFHLASASIFDAIKTDEGRAWVVKCAEAGKCIYELLSLCQGKVDGFDGYFIDNAFRNSKKNNFFEDDVRSLERRYKDGVYYPCMPPVVLSTSKVGPL